MKDNNSATGPRWVSLPGYGVALAALGVLAFSFSFPATAMSLTSFGPWTTAGGRGVLAGALAVTALLLTRSRLPQKTDWAGIVVVALGCGIGFPLLSTFALTQTSTSHSAVVIGLLPIATASFAALRSRTSPPRTFWFAALAGAAIVLTFTLAQGGGHLGLGDLYLFGSLIVCAAGYAEGGRLAKHLPGWKVIAWGVVVSLPVNLAVLGCALPSEPIHLNPVGVFGLLYVAAISQFAGFIPWYGGMARIGVERASQLQLAQPLLTLSWAVLFLGERFTASILVTAILVLACIVVTQRARPRGVGRSRRPIRGELEGSPQPASAPDKLASRR